MTGKMFFCSLCILWINIHMVYSLWFFDNISEFHSSGSSENYVDNGPLLLTAGERFCNRTVTIPFRTPCTSCKLIHQVSCQAGSVQVSARPSECFGEQKVRNWAGSAAHYSGCQHSCEMTEQVTECCPGYWGQDCLECPGGALTPCNDHGTCSMTIEGNGTCECVSIFEGTACELCAKGRFGTNCEAECLCVHGDCEDGTRGDGSCDCHSGYRGDFCDEAIPTCANIDCPKFARCVNRNDGRDPGCVCNHGYEPSGKAYSCQPVNPCLEGNTECDTNALCVQSGPGTYDCQCQFGYQGDGFICLPVDPCQVNNGGCSEESTQCVYENPGLNRCVCLPGYENYDPDFGCALVDLCAQNISLCHHHANCTTIGPGDVECICDEGYIGNGQECFGNILERLESLHNTDATLGGQLHNAVRLLRSVYEEPMTQHGPFTVFVPIDEGYRKYVSSYHLQNAINDPDYGRHLLRQLILPTQLSAEEMTNTSTLYTLEGNAARFFYKKGQLTYKLEDNHGRATILRKDVLAVNGMIHIVDKFLTKPPVIPSSAARTIADTLIRQPNFSQLEIFMKDLDLEDILDEDGPWTVFAPSNPVWTNLPEGTVDYLQSEEGKEKLKTIVRSHIVQAPLIRASDLVNTHRFLSIANTAFTVSVTLNGRMKLNGNVNITQTDILSSNGVIHHIDGLLLSSALEPLLPHRCDMTTTRLIKGTCGPCNSQLHCPKKDDVPLESTKVSCRYWVNAGRAHGGYIPLHGCSQSCNRTHVVAKCCENFYGSQCFPCPGGFQNPCFGRGQCDDGYGNDGSCNCDGQYYGTSCEYCQNRGKFGPHCNQSCSCLRGLCDNRAVDTAGRCRSNSCYRGYTGVNCDIQTKRCRRRLRCHAHAECVRTTSTDLMLGLRNPTEMYRNLWKIQRKLKRSMSYCRCLEGYSGPGNQCEEIDPCQLPDRGGCHIQAICRKIGPGKNTCKCDDGFVGDGTYCYPRSECQTTADCDVHARCVGHGLNGFACICLIGYHGNGTYCLSEDACQENNGGCHPTGVCRPLGPGEVNCTCAEGMGGDGYSCYGTLEYEVQNYAVLSRLQSLLQRIPSDDNVLSDLSDTYTLLAPNDSAVEQFLELAPSKFFEDEGNLLVLFGFHILPTSVSYSELMNKYAGSIIYPLADQSNFVLNITAIDKEVYINDAVVLEPDLPALNGYIHVIDKVLEPYPITMEPQTLQQLLSDSSDFTISYNYLKAFGLINVIEEMDAYTLFLPLNKAWQHGDIPMSGHLLLFHLLQRELMTWQIPDEGLDLYSFLSNSPNHKITLSVQGKRKIFVNGAEVLEPNLMTDGGVIHGIGTVLVTDVSRCDVFVQDTQPGECGPCDGSLICPVGYNKQDPQPVLVQGDCIYRERGLTVTDKEGCHLICQRELQVRDCCSGYYGEECQECPTDPENPCGGHGNCSDGIRGDGQCMCDLEYTGPKCEFCRAESCKGDPCAHENGGCHDFATCSYGNQGQVICDCAKGYHGDGYVCILEMCELQNGGCDPYANCSTDSDGLVMCMCPDGSVQPKQGPCIEQLNCNASNGGCALNATCHVMPSMGAHPSYVLCTCMMGFVGNGTLCNQDMWTTLTTLPQTAGFAKLIKTKEMSVKDGSSLVDILQDITHKATVFAPINIETDMSMFQNFNDVDVLKYVLWNESELYTFTAGAATYVALDGSNLTVTLATLDGETAFSVDGVAVVEANIPTLNGVIHLIASTFPEASSQGSVQDPKIFPKFGLVIVAVIASIAVCLLIMFLAWKSRHKAQLVINRVRSASVFERFNAQNFDFVRFRPATQCQDVRNSDTEAAASAECQPEASKEPSLKFFSNPVFSALPDDSEDVEHPTFQ